MLFGYPETCLLQWKHGLLSLSILRGQYGVTKVLLEEQRFVSPFYSPQYNYCTHYNGSTLADGRSDRWNTTSCAPVYRWSPPSCTEERGSHPLGPRHLWLSWKQRQRWWNNHGLYSVLLPLCWRDRRLWRVAIARIRFDLTSLLLHLNMECSTYFSGISLNSHTQICWQESLKELNLRLSSKERLVNF